MTIDLTPIFIALISTVGSVVAIAFPIWLASHMKDKEAAAAIATALNNGLGAMQQAGQQMITTIHPKVTLPGVSPILAAGIGYVLDQVPAELARFPAMTQQIIAEKLKARVGLANIQTNQAIAASPEPSPKPLDPVASAPVAVAYKPPPASTERAYTP
jgi:hypothetical protein